MKKIRIDDHLSQLQQQAKMDIDARLRRLADLQQQTREALARSTAVEVELERCTRLRDDLTSAGLPTTAVEQKIDELKDRHTTVHQEVTTLEETTAAAKREVESHRPVVTDRARNLFAGEGVVWMVEVESLAELVAHLPMSFPKVDALGAPSTASFDLGAGCSLEVPLELGTRSLKGTVPEALKWLPRPTWEQEAEQEAEATGEANGVECHDPSDPLEAVVVRCGERRMLRFLAVHDRSSNTKLLSKVRWTLPEDQDAQLDPWQNHGQTHRATLIDDLSGLFGELHARLRNELPPEGAPIRADVTYEPGSVAWAVQQRLLEATVQPQSFRECTTYLRSPEIERILEPHWKAFVRCRWHAGVAGDLALLKHLAEMGEKPKLWNARIEGHYGFRMRTRDHDWLVGELFVFPENDTEPSDPEWMDVYTESGWSSKTGRVAVVGRLALRVVREK